MQEIASSRAARVLYAETTRERVPGESMPLCRVGYWLETPFRYRFLGEHKESAENWIQALEERQKLNG